MDIVKDNFEAVLPTLEALTKKVSIPITSIGHSFCEYGWRVHGDKGEAREHHGYSRRALQSGREDILE